MPDDSFPVEVLGGVPVLAAPEEIDITNAAALRSALLTAAANGHGALVVDMTRTRFCDLSGLHARSPRTSAHKPTAVKCCWSFPASPSRGFSPSPAWTR